MPDQLMFTTTLIGLLITVAAIVGSVVWTVATIKSEGKVNRQASKSLGSEISKLTSIVGKLDDKVDGHNDRIIRLEEKHVNKSA